MGLFSAEPTEKVAEKVLKEFSDIKGLKEAVEGILALENSKVYEMLANISKPVDSSVNLKQNLNITDLDELAGKNLSKFPLRIPLTPLIGITDYFTVGFFVGSLYSIQIDHKLYEDDLSTAAHSRMIPRILLMLEDFDSNLETPRPTAEFFKKLGKVKWEDKKSKELLNDIGSFLFTLAFNKWGGKKVHWDFPTTEKAFIRLLSGCSAVLEGRAKINTFDVIRANKTYLKLINTDISKLM